MVRITRPTTVFLGAIMGGLLACVLQPSAMEAQTLTGRSVTTADVVQMATFGSQPDRYDRRDIDVPSPDGRLHVVVLKRGDLARNTNVFSLLLFRTDQLFRGLAPDTLCTLASSSNRPAIWSLHWLGDNHTIVFLGEHPGELPQIYALDVQTRALVPLTHQPTEITNFAVAPSGDPIVYAAKPPVDTSGYRTMREHGFALRPGQFVGDVLQGAWADAASEWFHTTPPLFFLWHLGNTRPLLANLTGSGYRSCRPETMSMAPSGRVALLECTPEHLPREWNGYTNKHLGELLADGSVPPEFAIFDLEHGTVGPLVKAPVTEATFHWSPTGEALVIANAWLPLDVPDTAEARARAARPGIVEVDVQAQHVTLIAHRDSLTIVDWNGPTNTIDLVPSVRAPGAGDTLRVRYRKERRGWIELRGGRVARQPALVVEEGLNQPPRLTAVDGEGKRRAVMMEPNPQLATLRFSREEIVRWRTASHQARRAGLYYPPDFNPGRRYPLVIQTHGFDPTTFAADGPYPTANAAQPLAAQGILVLQLGLGDDGTWVSDMATPSEAPEAMEEIESAIDYLDSLGRVDRLRVGIVGFSRTQYHVLYTLTHSRYPIAAAAVSDGVDMGYLQYLVFQNAQRGIGDTFDEAALINGGSPFGNALAGWRARAPGFNLDHIKTPLRLEALGTASVLQAWEPYVGLLLQRKPVELFVIPEGAHLLVKPWERLASSQGNVDWFRFWLKGDEDPDPAKREQYERWRELQKVHQAAAGDARESQQEGR